MAENQGAANAEWVAELEAAAIRLSDAVIGGPVFARSGRGSGEVIATLPERRQTITEALTHLNNVLRAKSKERYYAAKQGDLPTIVGEG